MNPVLVQKTVDRAVVGILVDFAKAVPYHVKSPPSDIGALEALEDQLEETPCYSGRRFEDVIFPRDKTAQLLSTRWDAG